MDLRGKTLRQLRRWEMFESCGVQDGAGGITSVSFLCWFISRRNKGVSLSYGGKMEAVKFMALLVHLKLRELIYSKPTLSLTGLLTLVYVV